MILQKNLLRKRNYFYFIFLFSCHITHACTGIVQKAMNGDWVYARTMEFGTDVLPFNIMFVPRGISYASQLSEDTLGVKWKTKYAHVGFNPTGSAAVVDGLNEKGLACGGFYLPGLALYETLSEEKLADTVSNIDFISWILGNFSTVKEVKEALKKIHVVGVVFENWGQIPPLHYIVVDETGDKIVIEYVDGKQNIFDAWIGTITNAPTYDWHLTNVRNYIGITDLNRPPIMIDNHKLSQFGEGSGAIGLPGDFTPPSRFVRASFLNQVVLSGETGQDQVERAFKILNQFDIPKGSIKMIENEKVLYEETQWTSASDLKNRRYFFHTSQSRIIKVIDLSQLKLNNTKIQTLPLDVKESFVDISSSFH